MGCHRGWKEEEELEDAEEDEACLNEQVRGQNYRSERQKIKKEIAEDFFSSKGGTGGATDRLAINLTLTARPATLT